MELETRDGLADNKDTLYLMGGLALMVLGAGLIMSNPKVRRTISTGLSLILPELQGKVGLNFSEVGSDIKRYMKLRSM
jgi:hypothetical protein